MTSLHPGATAPRVEPPISAGDTDLLERVRNTAVVLLAEMPRSPGRLRIQAGDVVMELDWATSTPAPPGPALAAPPGPEPVAAGSAAVAGGRVPAGPRITAPAVGTFYRCPEPGGDPFVAVGDRVKPGQQVAIVEVMKLMLPVEADTEGVITEVMVDDGQPVEFGQALFVLGPGG